MVFWKAKKLASNLRFPVHNNNTEKTICSRYVYDGWILEEVAPENWAICTATTLKPRFHDSNQPQKHTKQKKEGKEKS